MTMNSSTLTTLRLKLRRFTPNDIDPLHQILLDPVLLRYFPKSPHSSVRKRVEKMVMKQIKHLADYGYGRWALEPITEAKLIGWCGLQFTGPNHYFDMDCYRYVISQ